MSGPARPGDVAIEVGRELARHVERVARREARAVRRELERPWREGRRGKPAEVGRWVGFGLAVTAILAGIGMAFYADRPWDRRDA